MRSVLLFLCALAPFAHAAVDNPVAEKTGPTTYKISFAVSGKNEQISIYASNSPDRIDSNAVLAKAVASPLQVTADRPGRVYFHLKPRNGPTRVVAVRRLDLEGTFNTRDIGGYRAADGRYVRWGMIYRSDQLHDLTEHDYRYLTALGLRLVCDFRVEPERADSPTDTTRLPATRFVNMNIDSYGGRYGAARGGSGASGGRGTSGAAGRGAAVAATGSSGRGGAPSVPQPYNWLPLAVPQYSRVFLSIAAGDVPVLFHCFAGKDRTGMMAGLLLSLLGVPRETILSDYMLTNEIPDEKLPVIAKGMQRRGDNFDLATVRSTSQVTRGQMEATFASIDKKYGSVITYLEKEIGLSAEEISSIQSRLLQP